MTENEVREIARDEVASFCGLALNRLQDVEQPPTPTQLYDALNEIFGEALEQFGMGV